MLLEENQLDIDTYLKLRKTVNWKTLTREQAEKAIQGSLFTVVAFDDGQPVGMGRIVGDGAVICYIQDLIVIPDYQGSGVGQQIMEYLIDYVKKLKLPDTESDGKSFTRSMGL